MLCHSVADVLLHCCERMDSWYHCAHSYVHGRVDRHVLVADLLLMLVSCLRLLYVGWGSFMLLQLW